MPSAPDTAPAANGQAAARPPRPRVVAGGTTYELDPGTPAADLGEALRGAADVAFEVDGLLALADDDRRRVIAAMADAARGVAGRADRLLEAVLGLSPGGSVTARARWQQAAVELVGALFAPAVEPACQRVAERARDHGLTGLRADDLARAARRAAGPTPGRWPTRPARRPPDRSATPGRTPRSPGPPSSHRATGPRPMD
jgi:hypothetical protein